MPLLSPKLILEETRSLKLDKKKPIRSNLSKGITTILENTSEVGSEDCDTVDVDLLLEELQDIPVTPEKKGKSNKVSGGECQIRLSKAVNLAVKPKASSILPQPCPSDKTVIIGGNSEEESKTSFSTPEKRLSPGDNVPSVWERICTTVFRKGRGKEKKQGVKTKHQSALCSIRKAFVNLCCLQTYADKRGGKRMQPWESDHFSAIERNRRLMSTRTVTEGGNSGEESESDSRPLEEHHSSAHNVHRVWERRCSAALGIR
ncbi:UNVERIFIED_CONTAM: hypothetical protein FKN15_007646 [Acipenser sinensis]